MNSEWIQINDQASGRIYYANKTTRATQWEMPYGFNATSQPIQNDNDASKWNKAYDPKTGNYYWWHLDTKETTWTIPTIVSQSSTRFDAIWASDSDNNSDNGRDEDDDDDDTSDSDLEEYNPSNNVHKLLSQSLVNDAATDSDPHQDEKAPNHMDNDDQILVNDTPNTYWDFAQKHGKPYTMTAYATQYFQTHKHNRMFKKCDVHELVQFAPYNQVKHALLKMDSKLDKTAQQIWKNINSYMLLRRSSKSEHGHVDKLLHFALKAPAVLRDEIYCQICKQTQRIPSIESMVKGWRLMSICCSVFPPSDELAKYLATYLYHKVKDAGAVGSYATFALHALDRTMAAGQRRTKPMEAEIQRIEHMQPIHIKVYFTDGTFKTSLVTSQTQTQQVVKAMIENLHLNHGESCGLFEMERVESNWVHTVYSKRKAMEFDDKVSGLKCLPLDREMEANERIMDVCSSWGDKRKTQLVFKCKIQSKAQQNSYAYHDWKLAFLSEVWNVVHGIYPVEEDDVCHLAAIQLQATHGIQEDAFYSAGIAQDMMDWYVPYTMMNECNGAQLEAKILRVHEVYKHLDKKDAFCKYLSYLKSSTVSSYCGSQFFGCVKNTRWRRRRKDEVNDLLVGISENGILLLDPMTLQIVDRYKMEEILTYGFRSNAFLLVAGTLMCQRKFQLITMNGKQMNDVLKQHIDLRLQQAEAQ